MITSGALRLKRERAAIEPAQREAEAADRGCGLCSWPACFSRREASIGPSVSATTAAEAHRHGEREAEFAEQPPGLAGQEARSG